MGDAPLSPHLPPYTHKSLSTTSDKKNGGEKHSGVLFWGVVEKD